MSVFKYFGSSWRRLKPLRKHKIDYIISSYKTVQYLISIMQFHNYD